MPLSRCLLALALVLGLAACESRDLVAPPIFGGWVAQGGNGDFYLGLRPGGEGEAQVLIPTYEGQLDLSVEWRHLDFTRFELELACEGSSIRGVTCELFEPIGSGPPQPLRYVCELETPDALTCAPAEECTYCPLTHFTRR